MGQNNFDSSGESLNPAMKKAIEFYIQSLEDGVVPTVTAVMKATGRHRTRWYAWIKIGAFKDELVSQLSSKIGVEAAAHLSVRITKDEVPSSDLVKIYLQDKPKKVEADVKLSYEQLLADEES